MPRWSAVKISSAAASLSSVMSLSANVRSVWRNDSRTRRRSTDSSAAETAGRCGVAVDDEYGLCRLRYDGAVAVGEDGGAGAACVCHRVGQQPRMFGGGCGQRWQRRRHAQTYCVGAQAAENISGIYRRLVAGNLYAARGVEPHHGAYRYARGHAAGLGQACDTASQLVGRNLRIESEQRLRGGAQQSRVCGRMPCRAAERVYILEYVRLVGESVGEDLAVA